MAENLSKHLSLPWISTDQIGLIMRAIAARESYPSLFTWEEYGARYLDELSAEEIAAREMAKAEVNWLGVRKLIREDFTWNKGFIIEGDDILPHLVARDFPASSGLKALFIGDHHPERILGVVRARAAARDETSAAPDSWLARELAWVLNFGEKLKSEAAQYGFPWVAVEKNEHDLAKLLLALERSC